MALGLASTVVFGCLGLVLVLVVAVFWLHELVTVEHPGPDPDGR